MVRVAIVGTGDFAHGLAHVFKNNNTKSSGNVLTVTKPGLGFKTTTTTTTTTTTAVTTATQEDQYFQYFHSTGVPVCEFYNTIVQADIVVLGIPAYALHGFVEHYSSLLHGKILVDPTNSWKKKKSDQHQHQHQHQHDLNAFLDGTTGTTGTGIELCRFRWVKAFNDVGAVDLLSRHAAQMKKPIASKMCSPDDDALEMVKTFAESSLGFCIKKVPFEHYAVLASHQSLVAGGDEWLSATLTMVAVFIVTQMYSILRYNIAKDVSYRSFPTFLMNKGIAWTCLTGFALTQLPGILAHLDNLYYRDSLRTKPGYLRHFLAMRKHLGLISLWFLVVHIFMSCLIFGPNYYGVYFIDPKDALSKMNLNGELAFMCGSFGAALYCIMGICSLPSVAEQMTNRQWVFVYGHVAWAALFFGTFHAIAQGVGITWNHKEKWPWGLPPITLLSTVLPMFIMALKIIQVVWAKVQKAQSSKKNHKKYDDIVERDNLGKSGTGDTRSTGSGSSPSSGSTGDKHVDNNNGDGNSSRQVEIQNGGAAYDFRNVTTTTFSHGENGEHECEMYIPVGSRVPYTCETERGNP